jgi:hypothetical protein
MNHKFVLEASDHGFEDAKRFMRIIPRAHTSFAEFK